MPNVSNESEHAKHNEEQISKDQHKRSGGQRDTQQGGHESKPGQSRHGGDEDRRDEVSRKSSKA